jgi:hypothetical protein
VGERWPVSGATIHDAPALSVDSPAPAQRDGR